MVELWPTHNNQINKDVRCTPIIQGVMCARQESCMNWEAIGAIGEILGAAVIIATLFYLARQMKHGTIQQKLESHRAMTEIQIAVNRIFYDPKNFRAIAEAMEDWNLASEDSRIIFSQWLMDITTHYQTLFQMWNAGTVDDDFYEAEENFLAREALATPGGKVWWSRNRQMFSKSFLDRLETQMSDTPSKYFNFSSNPYMSESESEQGQRGETTHNNQIKKDMLRMPIIQSVMFFEISNLEHNLKG